MDFKITYKIQTGKNKTVCEDAVYNGCQVVTNGCECCCGNTPMVICVADGVGGNAGGEKASAFLLSNVGKMMNMVNIEKLQEELLRINDELIIYAKGIDGQQMMATTFTGIFFLDEKVFLAHCGNTRLYEVKGRFLKQITTDHSTYQWLISNGNYDAAENCNKSEILSAFGGGKRNYVERLYVEEIFERAIPSKIVLTSDGIHDYLNEDELEDIIMEDDSTIAVNKLVDNAVKNGSCDDCTVVVIEKME